MASIQPTTARFLLTGVGQVVLTPIVPSDDGFVREIRVSAPGADASPFFVVALEGETEASIQVEIPDGITF